MKKYYYAVLLMLLASTMGVYAIPAQAQVTAPTINGFKLQGNLGSSAIIPITITIPLKNPQLLYSMLQGVSTPGSSDYGHFITQKEAENLFYPTAQYSRVLTYLRNKGFEISFTALNSTIVAYGTPAMIKAYLGLSVNLYTNGSLSYYAAEGIPAISGASIYISNITGLIVKPMDLTVVKSQPNMTSPMAGLSATQLRSVYGATSLLNDGYNGSGYTIGILDLYGDPYIAGQLRYFDSQYGIPNPPNFSIVPIGAYNPNLGIEEGWADEISLDVEVSHCMAPGANITLYAANGALPIAPIIAKIVQMHKVNTLSQSFSIPESYMPLLGASGLMANVIMADQYYALGSLEGITFIASTGDAGGSGYSSGPEGTVGYPSTSPYVTAAGGTTVYIAGNSSYQTAWSNYGFVPFMVSYGGSTGGVSVLEPRPWYQDNLSIPKTYPQGRMVPDVSLDASAYPGTYIVFPGNVTSITGGTSEASPLLAGILTLVMQRNGKQLGLINPSLYRLGSSAFTQITYGYNIPWVANGSYNLVTGLGSINAQRLAVELMALNSSPSLNITVTAVNGSMMPPPNGEFYAGQRVNVLANITYGKRAIANGTFTAQLQTLQNAFSTPMTYNQSLGLWQGSFTVPQQSAGIAYVNVEGQHAGIKGEGFTQAFMGYVVYTPYPTFYSPWIYPESTQFGIPVIVNITDLSGNPAPYSNFTLVPQFYSILNNSYTQSTPIALTSVMPGTWDAMLNGTYPNGPMTLQFTGAYGYLEFMNGVDLQTMFILPQTVVEPGSAGPGQSIFVEGLPIPPSNVPYAMSPSTGLPVAENVMIGSNITAYLVSPTGKVVGQAGIPFSETLGYYYGNIVVPENATPGLYTVLLKSYYNSSTLGKSITGSFFGQMYVAPSTIVPKIKVVSQAFEGQTLSIAANITYANGTEVKYGMYTAAVYPSSQQVGYGAYASFGVPLQYSSGLWVGNITLASPYSPFQYNVSTGTVVVGNQGYSGPYDVYVSGISANGVPTTANIQAQHNFYIRPELLIEGKTLYSPDQTAGLALLNDVIKPGSDELSNDIFLGNDSIVNGSPVISSSTINGTVFLYNTSAILDYVTGKSVIAVDSNVTLYNSHISSLTLNSSHIAMASSSVASISPSLPVIAFIEPLYNASYSSKVPVEVNVTGQGISTVNFYVDGNLVSTYNHGGTIQFDINARNYPDGSYVLTANATQQDGLSVQKSTGFETSSTLSAINSTVMTFMYIVFAMALIAIILGAIALIWRRK